MYRIGGKDFNTIREAVLEKARLIMEEHRDEPITISPEKIIPERVFSQGDPIQMLDDTPFQQGDPIEKLG